MTGLLAKRVFWNFYDSLGAYTVIGFATVAAMPGIPAAAAALGSATGSGAAAAVGAALGLVAGFAVAARCVAGTFAFASVGADPDGPPPRSRHFRQGACALGALYLRWTLAVGAVLAVLATNAPFYLWLAGRAKIDDWGARPAAEMHLDDAAWCD